MEKRESSLCICPPAETKVHAEIWFEVFVTRFGWSPRKRFKRRSLPSAPNPSCLVLELAKWQIQCNWSRLVDLNSLF